MKMTNEERQAVERGQAVPVTVGGTPCVILRSDVYQRLSTLLEFHPGMGY